MQKEGRRVIEANRNAATERRGYRGEGGYLPKTFFTSPIFF